jgi:hypothetical protein
VFADFAVGTSSVGKVSDSVESAGGMSLLGNHVAQRMKPLLGAIATSDAASARLPGLP